MRISDWSSDVCSSDLGGDPDEPRDPRRPVALDERERGEQHKPSAHRRSDEDHRPLGLRVDQVEYIAAPVEQGLIGEQPRSEEHTSELQSLMRISYAVFCLKKKTIYKIHDSHNKATYT